MLPALVSLKSLIKNKSYHIDLPFFRLHYQASVCLLLAYCLILTAKVLFGDTIDCKGTTLGRDNYYDAMCYATGTYTRYANATSTTGIFVADNDSRYIYTGILLDAPRYPSDGTQVFWHTYYQYIPIVLFIQSILFYFPHYLWKVWENGMISSICKRLYDNRFSPETYFETNYEVIQYIRHLFQLNRSLVYKYYFCHVLCLINLVGQIVALNMVFNYQFVTYGYLVVVYLFFNDNIYGIMSASPTVTESLHQNNLNNPMDFVFPKITSCHIGSGSQAAKAPDSYDFMCVLPLNILNDKFFLLLWFWFLILIVLTALEIIYDFMFIMLPFFRKHLFTRRYGSSLFDSENRRSSSLPELFLLDLIGHNTDKFAFSALLKKLNKDDWTANPSENQSIV